MDAVPSNDSHAKGFCRIVGVIVSVHDGGKRIATPTQNDRLTQRREDAKVLLQALRLCVFASKS